MTHIPNAVASALAPVRAIPARPNLEFDRKQAKDLLAALKAGEPAAHTRLAARHPRAPIPPGEVKLTDAQLAVAREYGFPSWPQWKVFVETRGLERRRQAEIALKASCSSDLARARTLLNADPDLAREDPYLACAAGEIDTVRAAIARDPQWATATGGINQWTPLCYACFSRWLRADAERAGRIVEIARLLLEAGVDPNIGFDEDFEAETYRQTPLYGASGIANNPALTRLLLDAGADVDDGLPAVDPENLKASVLGTETLYHTSEFADTTCLEMVLAAKPDPYRVSYCLYRALDHENPRAIQLYLEAGADLSIQIPHLGDETALQHALRGGRSAPIIEMLLAAGARVYPGAYSQAIRLGQREVADLLEAYGADPTEATDEDRLLGRAMNGEVIGRSLTVPAELLCHAARKDDATAIAALVAAGAQVNEPSLGADQLPPLHWAGWRGRFNALKAMVEAGADLEVQNSYGGNSMGTTIHGSENCFDPEGGPGMKLPEETHPGQYAECVEYLITHGAPLPTHIWGGSEAVREVLRRHGVPEEQGG